MMYRNHHYEAGASNNRPWNNHWKYNRYDQRFSSQADRSSSPQHRSYSSDNRSDGGYASSDAKSDISVWESSNGDGCIDASKPSCDNILAKAKRVTVSVEKVFTSKQDNSEYGLSHVKDMQNNSRGKVLPSGIQQLNNVAVKSCAVVQNKNESMLGVESKNNSSKLSYSQVLINKRKEEENETNDVHCTSSQISSDHVEKEGICINSVC